MEIVDFKPMAQGVCRARFTVKMGEWRGLLIRDVSLFESNGKRWLGMPSRQYETEGKKRYWPYVAFEDKEVEAAFKAKVMQLVEPLLQQAPAPVENGVPF
jgi:hypothetical protein